MQKKSSLSYLIPGAVIYLIIPLGYVIFHHFPSRTILKEMLSLLTLGAFFLLLGQFYLSRVNIVTLSGQKYSHVIKLHKIIGALCIPILFLHPFFIVLPRYFEAGIDPKDAFSLMISNFSSRGILLGFIAMVLMILIGLTSMLRKKMHLTYTTWRTLHAFLSFAFIIIATWHAVDLGRHMDTFLSTYTIVLSSIGCVFLIRLYFFNKNPKEQ